MIMSGNEITIMDTESLAPLFEVTRSKLGWKTLVSSQSQLAPPQTRHANPPQKYIATKQNKKKQSRKKKQD